MARSKKAVGEAQATPAQTDVREFFEVAQESVNRSADAAIEFAAEYAKISQQLFSGYVGAYRAGVNIWLEAQRETAVRSGANTRISTGSAEQVAAVTTAWVESQRSAINVWSGMTEQVVRTWVDGATQAAQINADLMRKVSTRETKTSEST
jgi:hypothetical protein